MSLPQRPAGRSLPTDPGAPVFQSLSGSLAL